MKNKYECLCFAVYENNSFVIAKNFPYNTIKKCNKKAKDLNKSLCITLERDDLKKIFIIFKEKNNERRFDQVKN